MNRHPRPVRRTLALVLLTVGLCLPLLAVAPTPAVAAGGDIETYVDPAGHIDGPTGIAHGPDGNVWFSSEGNDRIGRISPTGDIATFTDPAGHVVAPAGIASGPDGNVWFTSFLNSRIGRITPSGTITTYVDPAGFIQFPWEITAGPDGNLWFTSNGNDRIGRITPSGTITTYTDPAGLIADPRRIAAGPDGNLWFTSHANNRIGRITPAGAITSFPAPPGEFASTDGITAGPDGNVWFTSGSHHRIGRMTVTGTVTSFNTAPSLFGPTDIVAGPDGALWFGSLGSNRIGRITTTGALTPYTDPLDNIDYPQSIVSGPNRRLWFTNVDNDRIGRIEPPTMCNGWPPPNGFGDVPAGAWYGGSLDWAKCHGLVTGFPGNVYRPNDPVNRAQAASIIWGFVDQPVGAPPHGFSDVSPTAWFARSLDWVKAHGIVNGFPGNVYRPNDPVNRAQIVSWLWQLAGQPAGVPHGFSDVSPTAWFSPALDWAKVTGLVSGFPGNVYRPNDPVNRAQIVDMLSDVASNGSAWSAWSGPDLFTWRF